MKEEIDLMDPKTYAPSKDAYNRYLNLNNDTRQRNSVARQNPSEPMLSAMARHKLSSNLVGIIN